MLTGYKTIIWAVVMAAFPTISTALTGIDWVTIIQGWGVSQAWVIPLAGLVGGAITGLLRWFTTTPLFQKE